MEVMDPQPLSDEIWADHVPEGFKLSSLVKFDRRNIGDSDSMKCKLLSVDFKDTDLRRYMGLLYASINVYQQ